MNCPVCKDVNLLMSERQGIEIDYCPQCRGIWLDRGELDKLIEKASGSYTNAEPADRRPQPEHDRRYDSGEYRSGHYPKKKKGGLLGELFDFD